MRRNTFIFIISLWIFAGASVALLASIDQRNYELRGYMNATQNQNLPFRIPRFGVNADLTQYNMDELAFHLDLMREANVHWIRQELQWDEVETSPDTYDWTSWDRLVSALEAYPDFELIVVINRTPVWQRPPDTLPTAPPNKIATLATFVTAFAERYGDQIDYYQIWDEPNIELGWGGNFPNSTHYAVVLQSAYQAIHAVDPSAYVMAAALAPTTENTECNISDLVYLDELYRQGLHDFSDGIAAKPYGFDPSPQNREVNNETLNFSRIIALREIMQQHDDSETHLWASNWGWNTLPENWTGRPSLWGQVSQEQQIDYTLQALNRAEREWPWLGGMILHQWQPNASLNDPQWGFALVDAENNPLPLLDALRSVERVDAATNGLYPARNPYVKYNGLWTFSDLGADAGWINDSQFTFDFHGSEVALSARKGEYVAYMYVTVDDSPANALPTDNDGNSYVVLRSGDLRPEIALIPLATDLSVETHRLQIVVDELVPDELSNRWPVVGFAVSSGDLAEPHNRQIRIAAITTVVALIAVFVSASQVNWAPLIVLLSRLSRRISPLFQVILSGITSLILMLSMYLTWSDGMPTWFRRESVQIGLSLLTSGVIYFNQFGIIIAGIALVVLFVLIFNRVEIGLMLIIFWSPFFLFPVELYRFAFPTTEVILWVTFAAWLLRTITAWGQWFKDDSNSTKALRLSLCPLDVVMLLVVVIAAISLFWAEYRGAALTEFRTLFIQPILFYIMLRTTIHDLKSVKNLVLALSAAGITVAVVGLFMWIQGDGIIEAEDGIRRLAGVYGSPNNVGLFLGRVLPFLLGAWLVLSEQRTKIFMGTGIAVLGTALLLTQSAGALFVGIPVSVFVVLWIYWRKWRLLILLASVILLVLAAVIASQSARFSRLIDPAEGTNFYRVRVWQSGLEAVEDHFVTGLGLDQFLYAFRGRYILPDAWEEPDLSHPHNIILDFWTRLGIAGVMLLTASQFYFWRNLRRTWGMRHQNTLLYAILLGLIGSMVNTIAHGMIDNSVFVLDLMYVYTLILAISITLANISAIDVPSQ